MIKTKCSRCQNELKKPGALVFSPPEGETSVALKFHICDECWPHIALIVQGIDNKQIVGRAAKPSKNPALYPHQLKDDKVYGTHKIAVAKAMRNLRRSG